MRIAVINEKVVKVRVKKMLKEYGAYWFMPVQTGYGASALDFYGCHKGRFYSIETKAPGKKLTPRQELVMDSINIAGGVVFVIGEKCLYTEDKLQYTFSGMAGLEAWLLLAP